MPKPRRRGDRSVEERAHDAGERFRLLVMKVVPASFEQRDLYPVQEVSQRFGVFHGDHAVALSPDHGDGG